MDKAREAALKILHAVHQQGAYANVALAKELRQGGLSDMDRRFVTELGKNSFKVATGKGLLEVLELQPPSRKRMSAGDFVRGHGVEIGAVFS